MPAWLPVLSESPLPPSAAASPGGAVPRVPASPGPSERRPLWVRTRRHTTSSRAVWPGGSESESLCDSRGPGWRWQWAVDPGPEPGAGGPAAEVRVDWRLGRPGGGLVAHRDRHSAGAGDSDGQGGAELACTLRQRRAVPFRRRPPVKCHWHWQKSATNIRKDTMICSSPRACNRWFRLSRTVSFAFSTAVLAIVFRAPNHAMMGWHCKRERSGLRRRPARSRCDHDSNRPRPAANR